MSAAAATRSLLLAISDAAEAAAIRAMVEGPGRELRQVTTGAELRASLEVELPTLLILDHSLPDVSGFEICRELRDDPRTRRVSVLVVLPPKGTTLEECFISGVNDFLSRPIDGAEVQRKVERLGKVADRRRLNTLALVKIDGDETALLGRAVNVSPSGLLVEIDAGLAVGSVCEVRFNLPGQAEPVRARGVIRRRARELQPDGDAFGIEFATLGAEDRGRLGRFFGETRDSGR